jgi:hypothetical protein
VPNTSAELASSMHDRLIRLANSVRDPEEYVDSADTLGDAIEAVAA